MAFDYDGWKSTQEGKVRKRGTRKYGVVFEGGKGAKRQSKYRRLTPLKHDLHWHPEWLRPDAFSGSRPRPSHYGSRGYAARPKVHRAAQAQGGPAQARAGHHLGAHAGQGGQEGGGPPVATHRLHVAPVARRPVARQWCCQSAAFEEELGGRVFCVCSCGLRARGHRVRRDGTHHADSLQPLSLCTVLYPSSPLFAHLRISSHLFAPLRPPSPLYASLRLPPALSL